MPEVEEFRKKAIVSWGLLVTLIIGTNTATWVGSAIWHRFETAELQTKANRSELTEQIRSNTERINYVNDRVDRKTEPIWREIDQMGEELKAIKQKLNDYHKD